MSFCRFIRKRADEMEPQKRSELKPQGTKSFCDRNMWISCLYFIRAPERRTRQSKPGEIILSAIIHTAMKILSSSPGRKPVRVNVPLTASGTNVTARTLLGHCTAFQNQMLVFYRSLRQHERKQLYNIGLAKPPPITYPRGISPTTFT